jgi:hypothetical protein
MSSPMSSPSAMSSSFSATLPAAVLDTILARLALLFLAGAGHDMAAARLAALQMLTVYHPETEDEFRLAAAIVSFSFHALEALSQAATPDMPLTRILRLRSSAVSLSRESHKAERRLDQLQKARRTGAPSQPTPTDAPHSAATIEKALELIADTRAVAEAADNSGQTWTEAYQQRLRARRMTENLKKNQTAHLRAPITAPRAEALTGLNATGA